MIKTILFDFNGVIINDEPLQMKIYQNLLRGEGIELTEADYYASLGMDDRRFVEAAFERGEKDLDDATIVRLLESKDAMYRRETEGELPLFPGVVNFIKQCAHHFTLGIVSMSRRAEINAVLQRADLAGYFAAIVSTEDVTLCKPDAQCYNEGFRRLDAIYTATAKFPLVRDQTLAIEDSPPGVQAAKAAGLKVLGVTNTVSAERLREAGADVVTKNLADWIPETIELVFNKN